jgi:Protein of unknown function (DUF3182)
VTDSPTLIQTDIPFLGPIPRDARGFVVTCRPAATVEHDGHEASTQRELARRLAGLKGFVDGGEFDALARYSAPRYFLPNETLTREAATALGIHGEDDLFGGVVPYAHVATKIITHPLPHAGSHAPEGWCAQFPGRVVNVVLDGCSAFDSEDAYLAGRRLLEHGPVRVKLANGIAGRGQFVVDGASALATALDRIDRKVLDHAGVVIEQNLSAVTTYSIGQFRVAGTMGTYYGTQLLTTNNHGATVYGGSEITVVRGNYDTLLNLPLTDEVRLAIVQARIYDAAADYCFPKFFASRRNYDVARGSDAFGRSRSGVLEQSWRAGGASGAEIGALEAFSRDPTLHAVRAGTREIYGEAPTLPSNAVLYFSGVDPHVGPLTKYAWVDSYADA